MTSWQVWHDDYDDPESELSKRLAVVQARIREWADTASRGPLRLISVCAGQGHDVVGALESHPRRGDVSGVLVERDEANVLAAQQRLREAGLAGLRAAVGDAARVDAYADAPPADLVLVCGVFGNVSDEDVQRTIAALPLLCATGATAIWTRHRRKPDLTVDIRRWLGSAGFSEIDFTSPGPDRFAVGTCRFTGKPQPLQDGLAPLFTFQR